MSSSRKRSRSSLNPVLGVQTSQQAHLRSTLASNRLSTSSSYIDAGDCVYTCQECSAYFWHDERLSSSSPNKPPEYHRCCKDGSVRLPHPSIPPPLFQSLFMQSDFLENIRRYNSVFAMTSFGAAVDDSINDGSVPYVFKVDGQICHWIGTLCPSAGRGPSFLQLYVYDTANELYNRLAIFQKDGKAILKPAILSAILSVLENCNQLVRLFRTARDLQLMSNIPDFAIRLFNGQSERSYDTPAPGCIGAIVYGNEFTATDFDIIVHQKDDTPKRISKLHPSYMSLQYPLLFPYGEGGWSTNLRLHTDAKDKHLTMNMFYSYHIHERPHVYSLLLRGGRLFQQYIVDAYVSIEHNRLEYFRLNQSKFRNELLQGIHDAIHKGDPEGRNVGKRTYLPPSFTGGPRYMYKHYQDALAICRVHGNPKYFITFTCNVKWPEIQRYMARFPQLKPQDQPAIVSRVFHVKVKSMIRFLKDSQPFGRVSAYLYTIEFQKRGLPHCHLLLWVTDPFKIRIPEDIDKYISAEIPNPLLEPELYKIVTELMIHGPCGKLNRKASCMDSGTCSKNFPKDYEEKTTLNKNGYAHYRRRADGYTVTKNRVRVDNGYVVPYNRLLSLRYAAHINVEHCGWSMLIKYLFKYISKGTDRIRFTVTKPNVASQGSSATTAKGVDEIQNFLDGRFICPHEAAWRILNLNIHERDPAVQVLAVHLENMQNITFTDSDSLERIVSNPCTGKTTLTSWLENNRLDTAGRHLRYIDFLSEYRWDASGRFWIRRSRHRNPTVGRLAYIHPTCGEAFYLRLLLTHQRGCQSFNDIRTVGGRVLRTYREACEALGLIGDNKEWLLTFQEASAWVTAAELRSLFTHMLLFCDVTNPPALWEENWQAMSDDVIQKHGLKNPEDIKQQVLYELQLLLKSNASSNSASLANYGLPLPTTELLAVLNNKLLMEEKNYDREELKREHEALRRGLHAQQADIYEDVMASIALKKQILLFVYGHGGTGKTYLWSTIISALRSTGKIVLAVAASGIAALLLPSGRTAHSRFRIPIKLNEKSVCDIKKGTQLSRLLEETSLIIWDEAPMSERCCMESLDRNLKDILDNQEQPFGGMSVILGGGGLQADSTN